MENFTAKDKQIFEDMKQCVKDLGLNILGGKNKDDSLSGIYLFEYRGHKVGITFLYNTQYDVAEVLMQYDDLPADKLPAVYELLNHINNYLMFNHFFIDPRTRIPVLRSGISVTGNFLDKEAFKMVITENLDVGHTVMSLINKLMSTNQTPQAIMGEFHATMDEMPLEFLGSDGKLKR